MGGKMNQYEIRSNEMNPIIESHRANKVVQRSGHLDLDVT